MAGANHEAEMLDAAEAAAGVSGSESPAESAIATYPRIDRAGELSRGAVIGNLVDGALYRVLGEVPEHLAVEGAKFEGLAGLTWIEPYDEEGPDAHLSPGAPVFVHYYAEELEDDEA